MKFHTACFYLLTSKSVLLGQIAEHEFSGVERIPGGGLQLTWDSVAGRSYFPQTSENLESWFFFGDFVMQGDGGPQMLAMASNQERQMTQGR